MIVKLLTEHHLEFLYLKGGTGSSESTLVKMPHCWKSHAMAQIVFEDTDTNSIIIAYCINEFKPVFHIHSKVVCP